jgi:hypothetical protein
VSNVGEQLTGLLESAVPRSAVAALEILLPSDTHPAAQVLSTLAINWRKRKLFNQPKIYLPQICSDNLLIMICQ